MTARHQLEILDQPESLRKPFLQSAIFHVALFASLAISTYSFQKNRVSFGSPMVKGGDAVPVTAVRTIPLPSRTGRVSPVVNDSESMVPTPPKPQEKKQAKAPEPDAIPLKHRMAEKQPKPMAPRYHPREPLPFNQIESNVPPAVSTPLFQKIGSGNIGVGENTVLGTRFGAYADLVIKRVAEKWNTSGLSGLHTAPIVIVNFDIMRDGSVRNPQVVQRSGNSTLDYSTLRAVMDAGPFPPLPPGYDRPDANVELKFQLQR